jgi:hypothetical protein
MEKRVHIRMKPCFLFMVLLVSYGTAYQLTPKLAQGYRLLKMSEAYGKERIQLITDIDDTVKSSGGVRLFWKVGPALGGIDTQYARGDFYPGVFQFAAEVQHRSSSSAILRMQSKIASPLYTGGQLRQATQYAAGTYCSSYCQVPEVRWMLLVLSHSH